MDISVVSLTFIVTMVTVVACELNMTASSQTTPSGSASALFDCDSSTCAEFTGKGYTDLLVRLPEPVAWSTTMSLKGTNLLCGASGQGRLYVVPSTTLEPLDLVSTCRLMSATTEGQLDVCTFSCQDTVFATQNTALETIRVIRRPFIPSDGDWTLCGLYMNYTIVCPTGYSRYCNHCYHYHAAGKYWDDAKNYCTSTHPDAYMAETNSSGEIDFIRDMLGHTSWIGGRRLSGTWTWIHSGWDMSSGYQNWSPGQPDGTGDCVYMYNGKYADGSCDYPYHVVCEYGH